MRKAYIVMDGKEFDDEQACKNYEEDLQGYKHYDVELFYDGTYWTRIKARSEHEAIELAKKEVWPEYIRHEFIKAEVELTKD